MFNKQQLIKGIILILVPLGIFFALYHLIVGRLLPLPFSFILSGLSSIFMLLAINSFVSAKSKYDEWQLIKKSSRKNSIAEFKDGEKIAIFGQIFPANGQPISSPFSHQPCVFYSYDIYQWISRGYGKNRNRERTSDYSGLFLTYSFINSLLGKIRLLSFPVLEGFDRKTYSFSDQTANFYNNAIFYIQNTKFESFGNMGLLNLKGVYQYAKDIITDKDGYIRKDLRSSEQPFDIKTRYLEEQYASSGENVCLMGVWSTAQQGIIPALSKSATILIKGTPDKAIRVARNMVFKQIATGLLVSMVINIIAGTFWWAINERPKHGIVTFTETVDSRIIRQETIKPQNER